MATHSTRILPDGSVQIPAEILDELGLAEGDAVTLRIEDGQLQVRSLRSAIAHARALIRQYLPDGTGSVDEFIAQRRADAERDWPVGPGT